MKKVVSLSFLLEELGSVIRSASFLAASIEARRFDPEEERYAPP